MNFLFSKMLKKKKKKFPQNDMGHFWKMELTKAEILTSIRGS